MMTADQPRKNQLSRGINLLIDSSRIFSGSALSNFYNGAVVNNYIYVLPYFGRIKLQCSCILYRYHTFPLSLYLNFAQQIGVFPNYSFDECCYSRIEDTLRYSAISLDRNFLHGIIYSYVGGFAGEQKSRILGRIEILLQVKHGKLILIRLALPRTERSTV